MFPNICIEKGIILILKSDKLNDIYRLESERSLQLRHFWKMEVFKIPKLIPLQFGQNQVINCWDIVVLVIFVLLVFLFLLLLLLLLMLLLLLLGQIGSVTAEILPTLSLCGWVVVQSHFHVKPNFCYVRMRCGWAGVLSFANLRSWLENSGTYVSPSWISMHWILNINSKAGQRTAKV